MPDLQSLAWHPQERLLATGAAQRLLAAILLVAGLWLAVVWALR